MELYYKDKQIKSYDEWETEFKKHKKKHWSKDRSAEALAKHWSKGIPDDVYDILHQNGFAFTDLGIGYIEHETSFDSASGNREHDLCFSNVTSEKGNFTLSIEAKVDEPFDVSNQEYYDRAKRYLNENPNSKALRRLITIYETTTGNKFEDFNYTKRQFMKIGYQLFSGLLGAIAEANKHKEVINVIFLIQVFHTNKLNIDKHKSNKQSLTNFLDLFGINEDIISGNIVKIDTKKWIRKIDLKSNFTVKYIPDNLNVYLGYLDS